MIGDTDRIERDFSPIKVIGERERRMFAVELKPSNASRVGVLNALSERCSVLCVNRARPFDVPMSATSCAFASDTRRRSEARSRTHPHA